MTAPTPALCALALATLCLPARAELVAWWAFDGNLNDVASGTHNGTPLGSPSFDTEVPAGLSGQSLRFGAAENEAVAVAAEAGLDTSLFTLGYFINQEGAVQGNAGLERLTSRGADSFETAVGNPTPLGGTISPTGVTLSYHVGGVGWTVTNAAVPADGWVHVAWRNTAANMELYLDGVLVFTGTAAVAPAGEMYIGGRVNLGPVEGYEGLIDDVFLWDDALNPLAPGDIATIAASGMNAFLGDGDGDGLPDFWEELYQLDPDDNGENPNNNGVPGDPDNGADGDPDADGLNNAEEFAFGTDPRDADSDDDTLTDKEEVDGGTNPNKADTDGDGLNDPDEITAGTDPNDPDSDSDGYLDGFEVEKGSDPRDPNSTPDPSSALVLHLDFEGNVDDQSGTGNNGTLLGGASYSDDVPPVLGGQSLSTNNGAESDGVNIAASPTLSSDRFTLAYWIKPTTDQESAASMNGLERITSRESDQFETAVGDASAVGGTSSATGVTLSYFQGGWQVTNVPITVGEWAHIAWVNNSGGMELYVNGVSAYTGPGVGGARPGAGFMRAGTRWNDIEGFEGFIDDLRLYAIELSAEQVMALASGAGGGFDFSITEVARDGAGGEATVTWNSRPGRVYSLDFSSDFVMWNEIDDGIASGGDSTGYVDDVFAPISPETGFYRVREN